jgi:tetratricopeptide (TPR) repeat protein
MIFSTRNFLSASVFIFISISIPAIIFSQNPESLNRRGVEAGEDKDYNEARESFNRAADQYNKQTALVLHNRALVFERQGNIPSAIESYAEAVRRNPQQFQSLERLGYWKYKQGKYTEAVELGEKALRRDPDNSKVKSWIEEAYRMKINSIEKKEYTTKEEKERYFTTEGEHFPPRYNPLDPYRSTLFVTFDFLIRTQYNAADVEYSYKETPGIVMNFPYTLEAIYRPYQNWAFYGEIAHHYTGAALPDVTGQSERLEVRYYLGKFILGGGLFFHHYDNNFFESQNLSMTDLKAGGSIHFEESESIIDITLYPRLIIPDGEWNSNFTYDVAFHEFKYGFRYNPSLMYYTRFAQADYYFFNHTAGKSDYYGYFDLALGGELINNTLLETVDLIFEGEITKRLNLKRTNVTKPYDFFNGQGLLGFDLGQDGGSYFSGQDSDSTIIEFGVQQRFSTRFFTYQKFIADMPGFGIDVQDYNLLLGLGYVQ